MRLRMCMLARTSDKEVSICFENSKPNPPCHLPLMVKGAVEVFGISNENVRIGIEHQHAGPLCHLPQVAEGVVEVLDCS